VIELTDLPQRVARPVVVIERGRFGPVAPLDEIERRAILEALEAFGHNKTQAARALGISLKTLHNKLKRYREVVT
jgi:DNA-binding NtrC family response regulator